MTVLDERIVTARKKYRCDLCDCTIPAGAKYVRNPCIFDGDFNDNKYHIECNNVAHKCGVYGNFYPDEFREDHGDKIDFDAISKCEKVEE